VAALKKLKSTAGDDNFTYMLRARPFFGIVQVWLLGSRAEGNQSCKCERNRLEGLGIPDGRNRLSPLTCGIALKESRRKGKR